jgi:hypothetical protein|tara:strand:- start:1158 stop:1331 length:174 start_codon:yes stop_codon:yes gene_type:complete
MKRLSNDPITVCARLILLVAILLLSTSCEWDTVNDKVVQPDDPIEKTTEDPSLTHRG